MIDSGDLSRAGRTRTLEASVGRPTVTSGDTPATARMEGGTSGMAWYWWVLTGAALVAVGYVKMRVVARIIRRNKGGDDEET